MDEKQKQVLVELLTKLDVSTDVDIKFEEGSLIIRFNVIAVVEPEDILGLIMSGASVIGKGK